MRGPSDAALRPVLVVEDSSEDFDTVVTAAERSGVSNHLVHAADADEARRLLSGGGSEAFAFVLLDNDLPGASGCELLEQLRHDPCCRTLPFVVYATSANPRERDACFAAGASAYHVKSVRFDQCLEILNEIFERWLDSGARGFWRVVLIEDNPLDRAELKALLLRGSTRRYEFEEAETGAEGLRLCQTRPSPACVVLDYDLPDMNAIEVLEALPRIGLEPEVPVVVLTGFTDESINHKLLRAGAQDLIGKDWMTAGSLTRGVENAIERHRATLELRASEQLNRSLMEGMADCVAVLDLDGRLLHLNAMGLKILGIDEIGPLRGRVWWSLWSEPGRSQLHQAVERARTEQRAVRVRVLCPMPDGDQTWWDTTISSVRDHPRGPIVRLLLIARDVTRREQDERALYESEKRLRLAIESLRAIVFEWDMVHDRVRRRYSSVPHVPATGEHTATLGDILALVHPDDRASFLANIRSAAANPDHIYKSEYRTLEADGEIHWFIEHGYIEADEQDRAQRLIGITQEVTERRRVEEALRESEKRLRLAMTAASLGTFEHDLIVDCVRWDARAQAILGLDQDSGSLSMVFERVHPDDLERVTSSIAALFAGLDVDGTLEYRCLHPDGSIHWIASRAAIEFEDRGPTRRPLRVIGTLEDITARKRDEAELRASQAQLREADQRKDEFLAMLGHELRNPLAAISSATELIKVRASEDPQLHAVHAVLERQSTHMTRLIDSLLEVSRIARGKIALDLQVLDMRELLERVLDDRNQLFGASGLDFEIRLPENPLWVLGDQVRLAQVFDNLIGNAVKFTRPPGSITISLSDEDSHAVIRVRDTGVGIRRELIPHVFDPFRQESQGIARSSGGLGLGLALVRGLVELHEGRVEAQSEGPGTGAEFIVRLPLTSAPSGARAVEHEPAFRSQRVLIVEDNFDAAAMLRDLLQLRGHQVTVVDTGARALEFLDQEPVDVVLCDIGLPEMSGYEVARRIREHPKLRGIGLVAITGYGQAEDRERTRAVGFDEHLTKPVDLRTLDRVLAQFR